MRKKFIFAFLLLCILVARAQKTDIDSGLVAYYPFNCDVLDYSGNGYNGVPTGLWSVQDHNGAADQAFYFDGIGSYIQVNNDEFVTDKLSVCFYIRQREISTFRFCMACSDFCAFTENDSVGIAISVPTMKMVRGYAPLNKWTFVVSTFDNMNIKMYIDGIYANYTYQPGIITDPNWLLKIGAFGDNYWEGELDEIRIYNRVLSDEEIAYMFDIFSTPEIAQKENFKAGPIPATDKIFLYGLPSDENIYVEIYDISGKLVKEPESISSVSGSFFINVSDIRSGTYFLRCLSGKKMFSTKIVIVN